VRTATRLRSGKLAVCLFTAWLRSGRSARDALDIQSTVKQLKALGVHVFVTQLGATDLTNWAGKMLLAMLAAFAEMERDLMRARSLRCSLLRRCSRHRRKAIRRPLERIKARYREQVVYS
jgi:DNA invertase Pin-like site-specific DNA recombinase